METTTRHGAWGVGWLRRGGRSLSRAARAAIELRFAVTASPRKPTGYVEASCAETKLTRPQCWHSGHRLGANGQLNSVASPRQTRSRQAGGKTQERLGLRLTRHLEQLTATQSSARGSRVTGVENRWPGNFQERAIRRQGSVGRSTGGQRRAEAGCWRANQTKDQRMGMAGLITARRELEGNKRRSSREEGGGGGGGEAGLLGEGRHEGGSSGWKAACRRERKRGRAGEAVTNDGSLFAKGFG